MLLFWQVFFCVGGDDVWCFLNATVLKGGGGGWQVRVNAVAKKGSGVADEVGVGGGTADSIGCSVGSAVGVGGGNGCGGCWQWCYWVCSRVVCVGC